MIDLATIRAWASDPAAPPDDACGYVSDLLAEIDRLEAERVVLLAPADGVDVAKVLALDAKAIPGPWLHYQRANTAPSEWSAWALAEVDDEEEQRIVAEGEPADIALIAYYRGAAPLLAREVVRLRARLAATEAERDEARQRAENAYRDGVADGLHMAPPAPGDMMPFRYAWCPDAGENFSPDEIEEYAMDLEGYDLPTVESAAKLYAELRCEDEPVRYGHFQRGGVDVIVRDADGRDHIVTVEVRLAPVFTAKRRSACSTRPTG